MNALGQSAVPIIAATDEVPGAPNALAPPAPAVPTTAIWIGLGVLAFLILRDFRSTTRRS